MTDTVIDASDLFRRRAAPEPCNDGIAAGRHARALSRQMVNAIVTARWEIGRKRPQIAAFAWSEANMARAAFHKMLRFWSHLPGFWEGYRAEGERSASQTSPEGAA